MEELTGNDMFMETHVHVSLDLSLGTLNKLSFIIEDIEDIYDFEDAISFVTDYTLNALANIPE